MALKYRLSNFTRIFSVTNTGSYLTGTLTGDGRRYLTGTFTVHYNERYYSP